MKTEDEIARSFLNWCVRRRWDFMLALRTPEGAPAPVTDRNFRRWIAEVEEADGTADFRWVRFLPRYEKDAPPIIHVLIGGLTSDKWLRWWRRWSAITGNLREQGGREYSFRKNGNRVRPILDELLQDRDFDVEMRIGPGLIGRGPRLRSTRMKPHALPRRRENWRVQMKQHP